MRKCVLRGVHNLRIACINSTYDTNPTTSSIVLHTRHIADRVCIYGHVGKCVLISVPVVVCTSASAPVSAAVQVCVVVLTVHV